MERRKTQKRKILCVESWVISRSGTAAQKVLTRAKPVLADSGSLTGGETDRGAYAHGQVLNYFSAFYFFYALRSRDLCHETEI